MYKCSYGKCKCEYLVRTAREDYKNVYMCPLPNCIKRNGWVADKNKTTLKETKKRLEVGESM